MPTTAATDREICADDIRTGLDPKGCTHRKAVTVDQDTVEHAVKPICTVTVGSRMPKEVPSNVNWALPEVGPLKTVLMNVATGESYVN